MNNDHSFEKWAGIAAVVSAPVALASIVAPLPVVNFDMSVFTEPAGVLQRGAQVAGWLRASLLLDFFGYYLLIAPLILVLRRQLKRQAPDWARLFASCLQLYVVIGLAGAAVLAAVSPRLLAQYATVAGDRRFMVEGLYSLAWDTVYGGLWNILEVLVAGIGWLGFGLLMRRERPFAGVVTIVLGAACLIDAVGNIVGIKALSEPGLYIYLVLAPAWALGMGLKLLRQRAGVVSGAFSPA